MGKKANSQDPLASVRARLEPLDIKTLIPFVAGQSTHTVADKRNTPKGLQALVNAKHIVTDGFIDAIVRAASPGSLDGVDPDAPSPSLLEIDFDGAWPQELDYLPPIGREPVPRGRDFYVPSEVRREIFSDYKFIFCDEAQFDTLQPCITDGGGKAHYFQLDMGKTTPEDIAIYAKEAAGEKGSNEFEDGSIGKGVVVVRFRGTRGFEDWAMNLSRTVELRLGQRSIEQNEFLDAILTNDASPLRRPLKEEIEIPSSAPEIADDQGIYFASIETIQAHRLTNLRSISTAQWVSTSLGSCGNRYCSVHRASARDSQRTESRTRPYTQAKDASRSNCK